MLEKSSSILADGSSDVTPPATVKVGDKEYTPEKIADLEAKAAKVEETEKSYKALQSGYSKAAEKASMFDKLVGKEGESKEDKPLTALDKENIDYMKGLGFNPNALTQTEIDEILNKKESEIEQRVVTKFELNRQIDTLAEKYEFVDKDELKQYMAKRAMDENNPAKLTPEEAFFLLYRDKITASNVKPADLPEFSSTSKIKEPEANKPRILGRGLKSNAMHSYLVDRLDLKE